MTARRGSAYLLVLAVSMVIVMLGVTSSHLMRIRSADARLSEDEARANLLARSAIEVTIRALNNDPSWRDSHNHDQWSGTPITIQAVYRPAAPEVELFVNNVSAGIENPGTFGAGVYQLSDPFDPYQGRISVGALAADSDERKRELTYRYLQERYRTA